MKGFCGEGGDFTHCRDKGFINAGWALIAIGITSFVYTYVQALRLSTSPK